MKSLFIILILSGTLASATTTNNTIKVFAIYPDSFDYVITSVMTNSSNGTTVGLNHRNGRSFFLKKGDIFNGNKILDINVTETNVFVPSINAYKKRLNVSATIQTKENQIITLNRDKAYFYKDKLRCRLIDISNAEAWDVRPNEEFDVYSNKIVILSITTNNVSAMFKGKKINIPQATQKDEEILNEVAMKKQKEYDDYIAKLHDEKKKAELLREREHAKRMQQLALNAQMNEASKLNFEIKTAPVFFYGTEYRYPTEFQAVPFIYGTRANGSAIYRSMLLPTRFGRYSTGVAVIR